MDGTRDRGGDGRTDMRRTVIGSAADQACDHLIAAGGCPWGGCVLSSCLPPPLGGILS
jgi:hypothetical protein